MDRPKVHLVGFAIRTILVKHMREKATSTRDVNTTTWSLNDDSSRVQARVLVKQGLRENSVNATS